MGMTVAHMVALAKAHIENLSPEEVAAELRAGTASLIDIREEDERRSTGALSSATHAPRGLLEYFADPTSSLHRSMFKPDARLILMCSTGGRSALAAETLQRMGYRRVAHLDGGLKAWLERGLPVERRD